MESKDEIEAKNVSRAQQSRPASSRELRRSKRKRKLLAIEEK